MNKNKFKLGDKVKIIKCKCSYSFDKNHINRTGDIYAVNKYNTNFLIRLNNKNINYFVCYASEIQLINPNVKEVKNNNMIATKASELINLTPAQEANLSDENQSLVRLGVIDNTLELVSRGYVTNFIFNKYKTLIAAQAKKDIQALEAKAKISK
ncbi:MAG: hypothetical protein PHE73_09140 [Sulfurovaceae bacterium]|nr:hypothetical protein [Sulfurovaceae bacterium]